MALAKYKRTKSGSSFRDQTSSGDIPSVQRGGGNREIRRMQSLASQRANRDEQEFLQNTRLGLNQGKVSEVGYYNTLAEYYNNKLATTNDPLEQVKLQNKIYTYMDAAKNAAEGAARKAASAQTKAANAEYVQFKADIIDAKADVFGRKLINGEYKSAAEFLDDVNKIYEAERKGLEQVAASDVFSDSSRQAALNRIEDMQRQYESPDSQGDYGGLGYKLENKDRFVMVQSQSGSYPGGISLKPDTTVEEGVDVGQYVKGGDGIFRQVKEYKQGKDPTTGESVIVDAATGEKVPIADMGKYADMIGKKFVEYSDPNDPYNFQGKKHIEEWNDSTGRFERSSGLTFEDGSSYFNAVKSIFKPVDIPRTEINIGNQPELSFGEEKPDLLNVEFKQPKFERRKAATGKYEFFKDNQPSSLDEYTKATGMSREDALRGETDIRSNPIAMIQGAGKSAAQGFNKFKNWFKQVSG